MKYDVFLSHANADKDSFVEALKQSFDKLGISVFYDRDSIEWGDDWKQKIYDGLANCKYGVIVVSENFFNSKWTEKELKELLSRQSDAGHKLILPIAYGVDMSAIYKKYKKLSDIQFLDASKCSIQDITIQLAKIMLSEHLIKNDDMVSESNSKYQIIKTYCEEKMCSSLAFFDWLSPLMVMNDFIEPYKDGEWIGWEDCSYKDKSIPLFQCRNDKYRINPQYYGTFKSYYDKEVKPQL